MRTNGDLLIHRFTRWLRRAESVLHIKLDTKRNSDIME